MYKENICLPAINIVFNFLLIHFMTNLKFDMSGYIPVGVLRNELCIIILLLRFLDCFPQETEFYTLFFYDPQVEKKLRTNI